MRRYEEIADDLYYGDSLNPTNIEEVIRTAAREAQVRVLEAAQDMLIFENRACRALVTLKERIENGEDL